MSKWAPIHNRGRGLRGRACGITRLPGRHGLHSPRTVEKQGMQQACITTRAEFRGAYQCDRGGAGGRAHGQGRAGQGLAGGAKGWGIGRAVATISYSKVQCSGGQYPNRSVTRGLTCRS